MHLGVLMTTKTTAAGHGKHKTPKTESPTSAP
jgi:hypothetical protein